MCPWTRITVSDATDSSLYPNPVLLVLLNRFVFSLLVFKPPFFWRKKKKSCFSHFPLFSFHNLKSLFEDVDKNSCFSIHVIMEKAFLFLSVWAFFFPNYHAFYSIIALFWVFFWRQPSLLWKTCQIIPLLPNNNFITREILFRKKQNT